MADRQFNIGGVQSAPADWTLPDALALVAKAAYAHYDGASAATAYKPCLRIKSDSGHVVCEATSDTIVAAGASADVSWFRRLAQGGGASPAAPTSVALYDRTVTVPTGTQTLLTWQHVLGPSPLNLANPQLPTFVTAGIYAVTATVFCFVPTFGAVAEAFLFTSVSSIGGQAFPLSTAGPSTIPACSISGTRLFAAGDQLGVNFFHNAGVNKSVDLFVGVQKID